MNIIIDNDGLYVVGKQDYLSVSEADELFTNIKNNIVFEKENGVFGISPKRMSVAFGNDGLAYKFSNTSRKAYKWPMFLLEIKNNLEKYLHTQGIDTRYNFALINYYEDGLAQIPWHSDDEKDLDTTQSIASISIGAVRKFKLKNKETKEVIDTNLEHGSLVVMGPGIQDKYLHAVLKTTKPSGVRYNITFRSIKQ